MSATSATSSNDGEQMNSNLQGEIKKKKRKKSSENVSSEIKEAYDEVRTNKRISQDLPKCNWLEDKIKELELSKRAEECQK